MVPFAVKAVRTFALRLTLRSLTLRKTNIMSNDTKATPSSSSTAAASAAAAAVAAPASVPAPAVHHAHLISNYVRFEKGARVHISRIAAVTRHECKILISDMNGELVSSILHDSAEEAEIQLEEIGRQMDAYEAAQSAQR